MKHAVSVLKILFLWKKGLVLIAAISLSTKNVLYVLSL